MINSVGHLIELTADGNNAAFSKLYLKTKRGVFAFLYTYFNNFADTEDAMQTVYLKVKKSAALFKKGTNGSAWILQIAKNYALDCLRKSDREVSIESVSEPSHTDVHTGMGVVGDAMQKVLTTEEQRIIILHVLWGYRHREIGEIMNIPIGTVTSKYKRAVEKLKKELKEVE